MAYNSSPGRAEYVATAAQTNFPFSFKIFSETDIKVYQTPVGNSPNDVDDLLIYTTDYTVTINGDLGGEIVLVSGATVGDALTLVRDLPVERSIEYQTSGDLLASTLNTDLNYNTYLTADREQIGNRYVSIPESAQNVSTDLPDVQPDSYLVWNSTGDALVNDTTIPDNVVTTEANKVAAQAAQAAAETAQSGAETAETNALGHVTTAQLKAWEAEAEKLTADSYATEAEDTPVNIVTSDGDGTFTYTPTSPAEYSSLHYSIKATSGGTERTSARNTAISASASGVLALATTPTQSFGTVTYVGNGTSQNIKTGEADGAENVTNGDFTTDTTGWTATDGATLSVDTGRLKITNTTSYGDASQTITGLTIGSFYEYSVYQEVGTAGVSTLIRNSTDTATITSNLVSSGSETFIMRFQASETSVIVRHTIESVTNGHVCYIDNVSLKEVTSGLKSYDPNWVSAGSYTIGDIIIHDYYIYTALTTHSGVATTPDVDTTNWSVVADGVSVPFLNSQVWVKQRNGTLGNAIIDTLRGDASLFSYDTGAEGGGVTHTFTTTGVTFGSNGHANGAGNTYVLWQEQYDSMVSGTTNQGKRYITASNAQSGKGMTIYVGSGVAGHEIPHGLGTKPDFNVCKSRDVIAGWITYDSPSGATQYKFLNTNAANTTLTEVWNDTEPTETVITLGTNTTLNTNNENYVAYFSSNRDNHTVTKMYQGTGAAGNVVPLGLDMTQAGAKVMIKKLNNTGSWIIIDNIRNDAYVVADTSAAEVALDILDFTTTGIILKSTSQNASGDIHIIEATVPNYDKPTGGLDIPAGSVISYAEGTDGTTGDLDSIETTTLHSDLTMTAGAKNYIYLDKGNVASTSIYPLLKQLDSTLDANSPIYNVGEGEVYDTAGTQKSRVYLGEVIADGEGLVIPDTLVEYPVAHQDVTSMEVHGDAKFHGDIEGKQICTAWVNFDGTTTPPTIRDSYNVSDVVRTATGNFDIYFSTDMEDANYAVNIQTNSTSFAEVFNATVYTEKVHIQTWNNTPAVINRADNHIQIFGGKA